MRDRAVREFLRQASPLISLEVASSIPAKGFARLGLGPFGAGAKSLSPYTPTPYEQKLFEKSSDFPKTTPCQMPKLVYDG